MKRAGIIQSSYIPWRGFFDFIASVDVFILFDDVAFGSKGSWRHRNQLKFGDKLRWLTIPVKAKSEQPIDEVQVDGADWKASHRGLLRESLGRAPFFKDALAVWEAGVAGDEPSLSKLNARLTREICRYLEIGTPIVDARPFGAQGAKTERLIGLLKAAGADCYLSGPSAADYIEEKLFRQAGIQLEYKSYDYGAYPQLPGAFQGFVSVLDLIANTGPEARRYLRSRTPDRIAVAKC